MQYFSFPFLPPNALACTYNPDTGRQRHMDAWCSLADQPSLLSGFQANERLYPKKKGGGVEDSS